MLVPRLYEDLGVLHQNTLPVHSYFIPTSGKPGAPPTSIVREDSDRLQMLSGCEWLFRYYPDIHQVDETDAFFRTDYRPGDDWKRETVPFCWQMRGYDAHQYTNIRYPFPFEPPYVPQQNPCGTYLHTFTWHPDPGAPLTYLHFEGVDSCFYVWLNGEYVGYSQVTHHTSEFDVTSLLREGENLLAVLVLKWCDGSYLEDQDKFRMSGIIRDVYLLRRPEKHITDYVITTDLSEDLHQAALSIRFTFNSEPVPIRLTLFEEREPGEGEDSGDNLRPMALSFLPGEEETVLMLKDVRLWNAETPHLYTLLIETRQETIRERVGFRVVSVEEGILKLNGSPIRFRGVNRHESDPITGPVVTREQILKDLHMIKAHNFNAVRTSHYPNVPYFYQLCDELGLYVIDEADNESHGTAPLYFREDDYAERMRLAHERIADHPAWIQPTLDRVSSMVLRNRNRPSILVWSMGNECGYGCTFEESLRWTKRTDPTRLTHYESAFYLPRDRDYDVSNIDLFGRMYPPFGEVIEYLEGNPDQPLLLVEYCHSMGNSPGDFEEYRQLMERYDRLCGGFVWEWCDHAVFKGFAENGKAMYWYGGDHGELQHDGNFCLDGLVYPDRMPHTGLYEYKNVHRPLRASYDAENKLLTLENHWDFLNASDCVQVECVLSLDGKEIDRRRLSLPYLPPHRRSSIPLELDIPPAGKCFLVVTYTLKSALAGLPAGHELGFDEIRLQNADGRNQKAAAFFPAFDSQTAVSKGPDVAEEGTSLRISGEHFTCSIDTLSGRLCSYRADEQEFLKQPVDFNLWRAPIDNDRVPAELWKWERLDHTVTRAYEHSVEWEGDTAVIRVRQSVAAMSVQPILFICTTYRIDSAGTLRVDVRAEKDPQIATLPRIGLRLFLDGALNTVSYYGVGPWESYIDKCRSGRHGLFISSVAALHEDYIRPQENGSHFDCDFVRLTGGGLALTVAAADDKTFSFNASLYTQEELEQKQHNYELKPCGDTVLCIDHRMAGIGSMSCGPELSKEYRVDADIYQFAFLIRPERL